MNAGKEFNYFGYNDQSAYGSLSRESEDLFAHKTSSYIFFDMRNLYPNDSEAKVKILQEIYDTERTYVTNLTVVDEVFIQQLSLSCPKSRKCFRTMFGEISAICKTHQILLESLRTKPVGEAFTKLIPFLKLYTSYASHYPRSLKVYAKLMARNDFRKALERIEQDPRCEGKKLQAYLIMPIQRIPRYIMLIESLMHQSTEQEDMTSLFKALFGMQGLSEEIQSCMTAYENGERLLTIQLNFGLDGHILEPGRVLVKEGMLYKREINGCANYQEAVVFLFNDILLYGHKRISVMPLCKYEPCAILSLRHCTIQHDEIGGCLFIRCGDVGVDFTADSLGGVEEWYKEIVSAIENAKVLRETLRKESFKQKSLVFDRGFWQRHRDRLRNIITTDMGAQVTRVLSRKKPLPKLNDSAFLRGVWSSSTSSNNRKRKSDRFEDGEDVIDSKRVPSPIFDYASLMKPLESMNSAIPPAQKPADDDAELDEDDIDKEFDWTDDDEYIPEEKKIPIRRVVSYGSYDEEDRRPRRVGGARRYLQNTIPRRSLGVDDIRKLSYQPRTFEPFNMSSEDDEEEEEEDIETKVKGERPRPWWETEQVPPVIRNQKPSFMDSVKNNCSIM